jgi:RNA polymerase sigma factor (sigma-70 family)
MMYAGNGSKVSFDTVYETLFPIIYRIAYRIVGEGSAAEDVSQEAFIKYYERETPLPDLNQTKYWLIRVVKNLSYNYEKKKARERKIFLKLKEESSQVTESGEKDVIKKEIKKNVQEALQELPYNLRVVLVLKEYGGLSYKEIGSIVGISEGNVKVRVFRGREKLAKVLKEKM